MRVKHKGFDSKGKIFRKELSKLPSSETESGEEVVGTNETEQKETRKRKKHKRKNKETNPERRSEKRRKSKDSRQRKEESVTESKHHGRPETSSIYSAISKNRITNSIGIYNKFKSSNTVLRETTKQRLSKKDLEEKTKVDLAKVLGYSSNNNSPPTGSHITLQASPKSIPGSCNYSSTGSMVKVGSAIASRTKDLSSERKGLPFKTPLNEISENLIKSLQPAKTFNGRDYLTEVKQQLRKLHRQSSIFWKVGHKNSDVTPSQRKSLKRKQGSTVSRNEVEIKSLSTIQGTSCKGIGEYIQPVSTLTTSEAEVYNHTTKYTSHLHSDKAPTTLESETAEIILLESDGRGVQHFHQPSLKTNLSTDKNNISNSNSLRMTKCRKTDEQSVFYFLEKSHKEDNYDTMKQINMDSNHAYDLLDFLDHVGEPVETTSKAPVAFSQLSPELRLPMISLPTKPRTDSPSPQQQFYPRKLY